MRILLVGNDPHEIGGVANYTRPLAAELSELGHAIYYFYSGAQQKKYNWLFLPYLKIDLKSFSFECAEIVNSPNVAFNFEAPELDTDSPRIEKIFSNYLDRIRPDVVHIHSRCGLPFSIAKIASDRGIPVFNTIHVYGLLCQKRVMISKEGISCEGPTNLEKCAGCNGSFNKTKFKLAARLGNTNKRLLKYLVDLNALFKKSQSIKGQAISDASQPVPTKASIDKLTERLNFNIEAMNNYVKVNICVSTDVKRHLQRFGVQDDKLMVQHIGSVIADKIKKCNDRELHRPIVVGNIGGVNYYKGTHILIDAIQKIRNQNFIVRIYGKYQQEFVDTIMKGNENLPIVFLGKYTPTDLPKIIDEIDIMVLPSICNDTAPQTIFESFSQCVPIIASNIGGFPDFIEHYKNGLLFEAGNSDDLAIKLSYILDDPDKIITYRKNIPTLKTIRENAEELISLYQEHLLH